MLYEDYIALHQIPELGFKENKTSAYIFNRLKYFKANIFRIDTGIGAFFDFKKPKTIVFRAEEDALPIKEENKFTYAYKGKYMHACGHDGHMAILINLCTYINSLINYPYNVLLLFQPSEESLGGSLKMIPFLKKFEIEVIIGLHVFPYLEKKKIYSSSTSLFAACSEVDLIIKGIASHIYNYKKQNDALDKGIKTMHKIKKLAKDKGLIFHVGYFSSGVKRNICPDKAIIKASLRGENEEELNKFLGNIKNVFKDIKIINSQIIPSVESTYLKKDELFSSLEINLLHKCLFLSDDFAFYKKEFPSLFFLLGTNGKYFLHESKFSLTKDDLENGLAFYLKLLNYFLNH